MTAQGVDVLCALARQEISRPKDDCRICTKRIIGRFDASQIASMSPASFSVASRKASHKQGE
jgi:hypothetical protein